MQRNGFARSDTGKWGARRTAKSHRTDPFRSVAFREGDLLAVFVLVVLITLVLITLVLVVLVILVVLVALILVAVVLHEGTSFLHSEYGDYCGRKKRKYVQKNMKKLLTKEKMIGILDQQNKEG